MNRPGLPPIKYNSQARLIPASILKIATAAEALSVLGPDFRFRTEFYQTPEGDLIIKGLGDPFLTSEEIALISGRLSQRLNTIPTRILIDQSAFELNGRAEGTESSLNPYDAGNAALAVNFNTIKIKVADDRTISSAEPQTPTLPIMQVFGGKKEPGKHRLNISGSENSAGRYAGQLLAASLIPKISLDSKTPELCPISTFEGKLPPEPVYVHYSSRKLTEVVEAMLLYSNNFIANQLFLVCGARKYGYPATWAKGRQALNRFLGRDLGLPEHSFRIKEGAGISKDNLLTAEAMLRIIKEFRPYAHLLPDYQGHLLKTGTMTGVYNYAGYHRTDKGLRPLVIMLNQEENNRDRLLRLILDQDNIPSLP
ncbi:MAG: D-alanyl-D-alanine carboxypeptidase/D-alanyl-D-alanine-endopeptidase [Desulfurivibrionaceae bacterium]